MQLITMHSVKTSNKRNERKIGWKSGMQMWKSQRCEMANIQ